MDKATPLHHRRRAVMPRIIGDVPGVCRCLPLLAQPGLVPCFDAEKRVQMVVLERLDGRGMGTQPVCSADAREVGVIVPHRGNTALGGMACASLCARAVLLHDRCRQQGTHGPHVRMAHRRAEPLMGIRDCPVAVDLVQTRCTVHRLRGARARASEPQEIAVLQAHHRFACFPSRSLSHHALAHLAERRGCDRIQDRTPVRVARDTLDPIEGVHIPLCPLLVQGEERGRCEGNHGAGGQRIGSLKALFAPVPRERPPRWRLHLGRPCQSR